MEVLHRKKKKRNICQKGKGTTIIVKFQQTILPQVKSPVTYSVGSKLFTLILGENQTAFRATINMSRTRYPCEKMQYVFIFV